MHPVVGKLAAACGLALGGLVFVVRKNQILAAAMNVERQIRFCHCRTFYMPAWPAHAPGTFPFRLAWLCAFPEREIQGIFLLLARLHPGAGHQLVQAAPGKTAVMLSAAHPEINVSVRRGVCLAQIHKLFAHGNDGIDIFRCPGFKIGPQHAQFVHILVKGMDIGLRNVLPVALFLVGAPDYLVVNIGKIAHIKDFETQIAQMAHQNVKNNSRTRMADMAIIIGCYSANIDMDPARARGNEFFLAPVRSIINLHGFVFLGDGIIGNKRGRPGCLWARNRICRKIAQELIWPISSRRR